MNANTSNDDFMDFLGVDVTKGYDSDKNDNADLIPNECLLLTLTRIKVRKSPVSNVAKISNL
jgi:hypothetical protein